MPLTTKPSTPVVVSLATHSKRYEKLEQVLPFILNQTLAFDTLVINVQGDLTDDEFSRFKHLETHSGRVTVKVEKRPAKWRSFNKFIHTVREYPDHHIITCDDDIRYPKWMFEELYREHERHKDHIIAHELNPVDIDRSEHKIMNRMCADVKLKQSCFNKYLTGCCFFPKGIFSEETIRNLEDYDSFYNITRATHDELWLWIHSTLDRIPVIGLNCTWTFDLDGAFPPDQTSLCRINGSVQEVVQYDERINSDERYGRKLYDIMDETPVVFRVDNDNLLAVCGSMASINRIYSDFRIVFDCTDERFLPSMLRTLVNAVNAVEWHRNITFRTVIAGEFGNGLEDIRRNGDNCVAYAVDNNDMQMRFLRNSINTLKRNYGGDVFVLVDKDFRNAEMFSDCRVVVVGDDMIRRYLPKRRDMARKELSYATFYRLLIPLMPEFSGYRQVLYLDCDTEVVKPIDGIFGNTDKEFYGVNEWWLLDEHNKRLGDIKRLDKYCNAGVQLINIFRISGYKEKLAEMSRMHDEHNFRNLDQDMLNLCFDVGVMDRKYNSYPTLEDTSGSVILHYVNSLKGILARKVAAA